MCTEHTVRPCTALLSCIFLFRIYVCFSYATGYRGRILRRNWDNSFKSFPPCYSQSPLLTDYPPPPSKSGLKLVSNINIVHGNLKSENSQDYAQKSQRNSTFMNSAFEQNINILLLIFTCYNVVHTFSATRMKM